MYGNHQLYTGWLTFDFDSCCLGLPSSNEVLPSPSGTLRRHSVELRDDTFTVYY